MIGVSAGGTAASVTAYFRLGPIAAGMVLRGVRLWVGLASNQVGIFGMGTSAGGTADAASFGASRSLVVESGSVIGSPSRLGVAFTLLANRMAEFRFPVYVPVDAGSLYVICALVTFANGQWIAGLDIEPERVVRPFLDRGRAARLNGGGGVVMDQLRGAAEAARV